MAGVLRRSPARGTALAIGAATPVKATDSVTRNCDLAPTLTALATDLFDAGETTRALERLRVRLRATHAAVWLIDEHRAHRVLHLGDRPPGAGIVEIGDGVPALDRLLRIGAVRCRAGEVAGLEALVPAGSRSYVAAAAARHGGVAGVLVLGFNLPVPPCDENGTDHLQLAAILLTRALAGHDVGDLSLPEDAILGSVATRIAVLDRDGTILTVNAAWKAYADRDALNEPDQVGPGANYLDACRRAGAGGWPHAEAAATAIAAVCAGTRDRYELVEDGPLVDDGPAWRLMTVAPLRRPGGGAVISHALLARAIFTGAERTDEDEHLSTLAESIHAPVVAVAADGTVVFSNVMWTEACGGRAPAGTRWTEACHPDDRAAADEAFTHAVAHRERMQADFRLQHADGTYRWWSFAATPRYAADRTVIGYLGVGTDMSRARQAEQALHDAGARFIAAQESVRQRIARELHDDIGQQVVLLALRLDSLTHGPRLSRQRLNQEFEETEQRLKDLATSIHNLSHDLHPAKLRLLGLAKTLGSICRDASSSSGVPIAFTANGIPAWLSDESALALFRIGQEAVQNAVKHSHAQSIAVSVTGTDTSVTLRVADDGNGFDPLGRRQGLGLLTMRERVEMIGGRLRIEAAPGQGTTIEAMVPVTQGNEIR